MISALLLKVSNLLCFRTALALTAWHQRLEVMLGPTDEVRSFALMCFS